MDVSPRAKNMHGMGWDGMDHSMGLWGKWSTVNGRTETPFREVTTAAPSSLSPLSVRSVLVLVLVLVLCALRQRF